MQSVDCTVVECLAIITNTVKKITFDFFIHVFFFNGVTLVYRKQAEQKAIVKKQLK
jgi:hypothetical protein